MYFLNNLLKIKKTIYLHQKSGFFIMSKGFGKPRPEMPSQNRLIVSKLIVALQKMPPAFRRNFAAAIWDNHIDSLEVYLKQLCTEAGFDTFIVALIIYDNKKLEKGIEKAIQKELHNELEDMR